MCSCPAHRDLVDCVCQCDHTNDRLAQWHARALAAEAEVARLRAGESDEPPAPCVRLTPAEWIRKWNDAAPDRRLHAAERVLGVIDQESRCVLMDHDGRLEFLEAEQKTLVQQRDRYADAIAHQIALHRQRPNHGELNRRACLTCAEFTQLAAEPAIIAAHQRQMAALVDALQKGQYTRCTDLEGGQ